MLTVHLHKAEINTLIGSRFDALSAKSEQQDAPPSAVASTTNGVKHERSSEATSGPSEPSRSPSSSGSGFSKRVSPSEDSDVVDDAPPKKKVKRPEGQSDAELAARLQAEENARSRPTRGGGTRKRAPVKAKTPKKSKKKSSAKVKADDDSELDSGSADDKPVKRNGAFHVRAHIYAV